MSPFSWLQQLFATRQEPDDPNVIPVLEDDEPFILTQHMRIILAIFFCAVSAGVLWWIMM